MSGDSCSAGTATRPAAGKQAAKPWNPWWWIALVVFVYYASQVFGSLFVSAYPALRHWPQGRSVDWLNNSVGAQFAFIVLAETFTVGAVYLFLKRQKLGFASIGLKRPRWSDPFYGLIAVVPYFVLYALTVGVVSHFVPSLNINEQQQIGFTDVHGGPALLMTFISLVVLPPLAEEIIVRGVLYTGLKKILPAAAAVLATSAIFAAAHLREGGIAGPLYIAAIDTFVLSLVLIYLREKTGSLWAGITLHAIKNGIAFTALFVLHVH